jgi:hypothetical protein
MFLPWNVKTRQKRQNSARRTVTRCRPFAQLTVRDVRLVCSPYNTSGAALGQVAVFCETIRDIAADIATIAAMINSAIVATILPSNFPPTDISAVLSRSVTGYWGQHAGEPQASAE